MSTVPSFAAPSEGGAFAGMRVLLHAPTAGALARARNNAMNLLKEGGDVVVVIVVNGDAVAAALDTPQAAADALTLVCPNTLRKLQRDAPAPLTVLPNAAVFALAAMQDEGWRYIRA